MSVHLRHRGFTLIELLVAVSIMALMAVMSWRSLDGMQSATSRSTAHSDAVLAMDAGLGQWIADLDAVVEPGTQGRPITPLDWDGRALRLTRRHSADSAGGQVVVAWTKGNRNGVEQWLRWESPAVTSFDSWKSAWTAAALWAQSPSDASKKSEVFVANLSQWQIYFYRGNAWSNPLSSSGTGPAMPLGTQGSEGNSSVPDGIRLSLVLDPPHPLAGTLTRDWVRPSLTSAAP